MNISETILTGCYVIEPKIFEDTRGYFFESFNKKNFRDQTGLEVHFVQDNQSKSSYGVLRGLHFQKGDAAQAKLVRVLTGEVLDVAVDLRPSSSTYGRHVTVRLSANNKKQLFVPRGFAHGFIVLSHEAEFFYKCDNYYNKDLEGGIIFNDEELEIDWLLEEKDIIVSEKDLVLPKLRQIKKSDL